MPSPELFPNEDALPGETPPLQPGDSPPPAESEDDPDEVGGRGQSGLVRCPHCHKRMFVPHRIHADVKVICEHCARVFAL